MENLWKELLAYVKKKTVMKKVLEYVEKDILLKNALKFVPRLVVGIVVIILMADIGSSGIEYFSRSVRQDLYEHIPDIHIYGTDTLLCDELTITARTSDRAFSSRSFILTAKGNVIKEYYTKQLLQKGWIKGKNEKGEDFHFHTDRYDEFRFYKDGYTLDVFFDIPLDQDPDKLIWGDQRKRYVITMTKTEFY
ncbi:hypothetical protein [Dialister invisus]|jgi:hypothetical protein|uniref:hypothetical protein n=1 Tax=Dialister invisus TaxID=218538 RepID=UPI002EC9ACD2|nr:hypothetical protein [Dialister invisus]